MRGGRRSICERVPATTYHGNFVSLNLICQDDGLCRVIEWEFSDRDFALLLPASTLPER